MVERQSKRLLYTISKHQRKVDILQYTRELDSLERVRISSGKNMRLIPSLRLRID